jgi:HlyD family secretion protein
MRSYFVAALAAAGFAITAFAVVRDDHATPAIGAPSPTALPPFSSYVEGTGITEASTGNIAIGTPVPGIVRAVNVIWGQEVKAGDTLFTIDDTDVKAQLLPAQAAVGQADADLAKAKNLLEIGNNLAVGTSISKVEVENRRYDVAIKQAALAAAKAKVKQLDIELSRHAIKAPVAGRVLQINTRVGEYAPSGVLNPPLMLFGDDRLIYLRVSVDEDDAWRVRPNAPAVAFVRGNPGLKTPLTFVRFDPYLVPKTLLTGSSTDRTDMRVLHVVYSFPRGQLPVYLGQEMDAFIKAPPINDSAAAATGSGDGRQ